MLAQTAHQLYLDQDGHYAFEHLIRSTLRNLRQLWQTRADERWQFMLDRYETADFLRSLDKCGDGILRKSWSATFVAGRVEHDSGSLQAVNLGDGSFLVQEQDASLRSLDRSTTRLWLCLEHLPDATDGVSPLRFKMLPEAELEADVLTFQRVQWVLCMTDGATSGPIHNVLRSHGVDQLETLAALLKKSRQKTFDDRTLILGRLLDRASKSA